MFNENYLSLFRGLGMNYELGCGNSASNISCDERYLLQRLIRVGMLYSVCWSVVLSQPDIR